MHEAAVTGLVAASVRRNGLHEISGILIYGDGKFIQGREGPKGKVEALYMTIRGDRRHRDVTTLVTTENDSRDFPGWAMAYSDDRNAAVFEDLRRRLDDILDIRKDDPEHPIYQLLQRFLAGDC